LEIRGVGGAKERAPDSLGTLEQKLKLGRTLHLLRDCSNNQSKIEKERRGHVGVR